MKALRSRPNRRPQRRALLGQGVGGRVIGILAMCVTSVVGCMFHPIDASMRRVVQGLTYGESKPVPRVDHELYLYALLKPTLVRKFSDCTQATKLMEATLGGIAGWKTFTEVGNVLNSQATGQAWAGLLAAKWGGLFSPNGDPMVPLALGEAASQVATYLQDLGIDQTTTNGAKVEVLQNEVQVAGQKAVSAILHQACDSAPSVDGPSLALSGGAANGAFVAGFMYELLLARELKWREIQDPVQQTAFLDSSRFSGVVGTSVGSLIGQILDLYATVDFAEDLDGAKEQFRKDKNAFAQLVYEKEEPPPGRSDLVKSLERLPGEDAELARQWALVKLFEHFTDIAEPEAICVQPGPASRLIGYPLGSVPGLMRFDPLQRELIDPFLAAVGLATTRNGFPRIAVSVEVSQNLTVGLDDTACRDQGPELANCLASGTMASTVLPFFAQPVNRVRTGLTGKEDCGIWLDGGLRSGFPIARALSLSRPSASGQPARLRTLAISTSRATGLPSGKTEDTLLDIAAAAIGEMGDQVQVSEVVSSSHFLLLQQERWSELVALMTAPSVTASPAAPATVQPATPATVQPATQLQPKQNSQLEVVFVPHEVPDSFVAGVGYRFDPLVMRGLFASGQLEAVRRAKQGLIARLGWGHSTDVLAKLTKDEAKLKEWIERVGCLCSERSARRLKEGSDRFERRVESCPEAPTAAMTPDFSKDSTVPRYFGGASATCRNPEEK